MSKLSDEFEIAKPRWGPVDSGWWLTAAGTGFTMFGYMVPSIVKMPALQRVGVSIVILLLSPLLATIFNYARRWVLYIWNHHKAYDRLLSSYRSLSLDRNDLIKQNEKARQTIRLLLQFHGTGDVFDVTRVQFFRHKLYVRLGKRGGAELTVGQSIIVIDGLDGFPLGEFRVIDDDATSYVAIQDGHIDSVWLGYIVKCGESEMAPPPGSIAVLHPKDLANYVRSEEREDSRAGGTDH